MQKQRRRTKGKNNREKNNQHSRINPNVNNLDPKCCKSKLADWIEKDLTTYFP